MNRSKYWAGFVSQLFNKKDPGVRVVMRDRFHEFKKELAANFTRKQIIRKC